MQSRIHTQPRIQTYCCSYILLSWHNGAIKLKDPQQLGDKGKCSTRLGATTKDMAFAQPPFPPFPLLASHSASSSPPPSVSVSFAVLVLIVLSFHSTRSAYAHLFAFYRHCGSRGGGAEEKGIPVPCPAASGAAAAAALAAGSSGALEVIWKL